MVETDKPLAIPELIQHLLDAVFALRIPFFLFIRKIQHTCQIADSFFKKRQFGVDLRQFYNIVFLEDRAVFAATLRLAFSLDDAIFVIIPVCIKPCVPLCIAIIEFLDIFFRKRCCQVVLFHQLFQCPTLQRRSRIQRVHVHGVKVARDLSVLCLQIELS